MLELRTQLDGTVMASSLNIRFEHLRIRRHLHREINGGTSRSCLLKRDAIKGAAQLGLVCVRRAFRAFDPERGPLHRNMSSARLKARRLPYPATRASGPPLVREVNIDPKRFFQLKDTAAASKQPLAEICECHGRRRADCRS
jgi:hypothetical protein